MAESLVRSDRLLLEVSAHPQISRAHNLTGFMMRRLSRNTVCRRLSLISKVETTPVVRFRHPPAASSRVPRPTHISVPMARAALKACWGFMDFRRKNGQPGLKGFRYLRDRCACKRKRWVILAIHAIAVGQSRELIWKCGSVLCSVQSRAVLLQGLSDGGLGGAQD